MSQVFVNGCFDILHVGHIRLFKHASSFGKVTVAINSDDSIKKIKGIGRPINNLDHRMEVLKSIRYITRVVVFEQATPALLLDWMFKQKIGPDVIVKGIEYKNKELAEKKIIEKYGCHVVYFDSGISISTTELCTKS